MVAGRQGIPLGRNDIHEINHTLKCRYEIKWSYAPRSYERNFSNCVEKTGKFRTSKRFEPVTLLRRCGALTIWATKPQMVGAGHLRVQMFPWWMDQWTKWNKWWIIIILNCRYEIKWSSDPRISPLVFNSIFHSFTAPSIILYIIVTWKLWQHCDKNTCPLINTSLVYDLQIHKWYFSRHLYTSEK